MIYMFRCPRCEQEWETRCALSQFVKLRDNAFCAACGVHLAVVVQASAVHWPQRAAIKELRGHDDRGR